MTTTGTVREWHGDDGWGVIDSDETPGGCWVHLGALRTERLELDPGEIVRFTFDQVDQDGFAYQAQEAWPADDEPAPPDVDNGPSPAFESTLSMIFDEDGPAT